MPTYLVKPTGKSSADYMTVRRNIKNRGSIIAKWKVKGYKLVEATNPHRAIEKVTGIKLGKVISKQAH